MSERTNLNSLHDSLEERVSESSSMPSSPSNPTGSDGADRTESNKSGPYQQSNLTANQLQVWIGQALVPETPIFHLAAALNIYGEIDPTHFQKAFQVLINSSDALRTVVEETEGVPVQRVLPDLNYKLDFMDFSLLPEPEKTAKTWMEERCQTHLNLQERLFDAALIKLSESRFVWYFNAHHLICDGWSFELISRHMADLYQRSRQGDLPLTLPLPPFADYVAHERADRESSRHRKAEAYWKQKLGENGDAIAFYGKVPFMATTRTRRISHDLGPELTEKLKSVAATALPETKDVSPLHVFAAILVAYVHSLNRKQSYTIGIPFHNRRSKASKETIGFFSEILPVRVDVADDDTFASLVNRVKGEVLKAVRHGQHSITNPYFKKVYEVVVNYHTSSLRDFAGAPFSPEWIHNGHGDDSLALQVHDFGASGGLALDFDLHQSVFSEKEAQHATRHFLRVLEAFLADPHQPLQRLTLLSPEEIERVTEEWSRPAAEPVGQHCAHEIFEEQAGLRPNETAIVFENEKLTYADLNRRANKLARHLRKRGVGPRTLVGLYVERSPEMIIGLLGILKAGAAYVPIDPTYPHDWLKIVLEDTRAPVLLTQRRLLESLPQDGPEIICLDSTSQTLELESEQNLSLESTGDDLAYVIYTSGSTGLPKGVEIPHKALVNFTQHAGQFFKLEPGDRVLQFASISFDTAIEEIFPCLTHGSTLVLRTESMLDSVSVFLEKCREWGITILDLPTSYWHEFTARLFSEGLVMPDRIRLVIIGGERAVPERLALWQTCVGKRVRLLNTYGPTEATVAATMCDLTDTPAGSETPPEVPIGRPISNVQTYVLNPSLKPVPPGVPGELYIGGVGLALGYHNRTELTKEKFIPDPFSKIPGSRLYKTGDLVRYRPDGNLEFLRRIDLQVKVRGFRVELEGIETVLKRHPLVQEAVVVLDSSSTQKQLIACIVPKESAILNPDELRGFAERKLPEYMIPAAFVILDSLPLTPGGKVDRRALQLPQLTRREPSKSHVPPRTPTEEQLARIWADVLGLGRVGREDHFFELGGHSLLATQVISRIRKEMEVDIPLRAIFEAPTIADLARRVEQAGRQVQKPDEMAPIVGAGRANERPLSFSQSRIWFMDQLAPDSAAYNIAATLRFTGKLQKEALKQSLDALVRRHEALRTTFRRTGEKLTQVVAPELVLDIPERDLRGIPEALRLEEAKQVSREEASRPFDLERGPLIRVLLLQLDEEDHVLLVNIHHGVSDQWSMGVIASETTLLYNAFCNGSPASMDLLSAQYSDFAVWQGQWLAGDRWETQLSYWKKQLADLQPLALPTDYPRPSAQTFHGAHHQLTLSKNIFDGLKKVSARENATLYMIFLAAFKILMLRYSGQEDIAIGSPIANRNRIEWEGIVGTFINMLVLRTDLSGNPTFREVLRRVREVVLNAFANQELPFEKLVEELQPKRDPSQPPLVQVLFNFHHLHAAKLDLQGLSSSPFEIESWASQFDICVTIDPEITHKIWVAYNTDLYEAGTIVRMLRHYVRLLEGIVADADQPIARLPIFSDLERRQLLLEWNNTQENYPQSCLHELFETQARQTPDSVAVVFERQQITYRDLNEQADQLAKTLRSMGVKPEIRVGICMERSPELVIGLLGILKAGGAYVPIDSAYPPERIAFMVADSGMHLLLTQNKLVKSLQPIGHRAIPIEHLLEKAQMASEEDPVPPTTPENLAYVIYTSGSTGKPKGVEIEHKALVNFLHSMRQKTGITSEDTLLSVTTISFDIAALELFMPLTVGAGVILVTREIASDGRRLREQLENARATVMQATPATWRMLLEAGWKGNRGLRLLCGGEALSLDLAKALLERSSAVWNLYGPTETTVWSTAWQVDPNYGRISIGRPIANTRAYILDSNLEPVPVGVAGELYLGGEGVARGYFNRPELTAEKFIVDPYNVDPTARLYKTGDLSRYLPDGNIEFFGRKDYQVKIRGYRIEPGEVEAVLCQHPSVQQVVVLAREDMPGDKRLVAYVTPRQQAVLMVNDLRTFLKAKLPEYMVPSAFVLLDTLPLTPNGKLDRKALPVPDSARSESKIDFVAPRDHVERRLAKIWEKLLEAQPIGVKDNFFDLGGHSLLAVRLTARVEEGFGKSLPLATLFQAPTIEQLADILRCQELPSPGSLLVPFQTQGSKPPLFFVSGGHTLVRYLSPDQPVYGLSPLGIFETEGSPVDVKGIAARYIQSVRALQPKGPYYLAGYSAGGIIAFEMAQQLHTQDEKVALLVLLDTYGPKAKARSLFTKIPAYWKRLIRLKAKGKVWHPLRIARFVRERIQSKVSRSPHPSFRRSQRSLPLTEQDVLMAYDVALRKYVARAYPGQGVLFRSNGGTPGFYDDPDRGWSGIMAGGLEIHDISGDHHTMLWESHARVLAEKLSMCLEKAAAEEERRRNGVPDV